MKVEISDGLTAVEGAGMGLTGAIMDLTGVIQERKWRWKRSWQMADMGLKTSVTQDDWGADRS